MATDVARALRERFEADALLGATALPMRMPERKAAAPSQARSAPTSSSPPDVEVPTPSEPFVVLQDVAPAEAERRSVELNVIDEQEVRGCTKCGLHETRTKTAFGVGSHLAKIVFVGEAPGHDEDKSGVPFVGKAGQLLTDMIQKGMGLRREDVYICNVIKCRPPNNRTPALDEVAACKGYLWRQLEILQPAMIVALGAPAAQTLLGRKEGIGRLRGRFYDFFLSGNPEIGEPIPLLPTFHPAYLLRSPGEKTKAWADLKMVMARMGIPVPPRG